MASFMLHLAVALIWLFLAAQPTLAAFVVGLAIGFALLWVFRRIVGSENYIRRSLGLFRFIGIFIREFIKSNLVIAWAALARRRSDIHPDFIRYSVAGLTPLERFLLAQVITLTPGTTAVDIVDEDILLVHAFDAENPEGVCSGIDQTLKRGILAFTR
ncbi:MAG: Na+/H+ antiporter subunit E [Candidatus Methylacidiphilales bacterium]